MTAAVLALPRIVFMAREQRGRLRNMIAEVAVATVVVGGAALIPSVIAPLSPSGVDVWVATNGNDSSCVRGNTALPCLTVTKALTLAQNNDQIEVAAGSYTTEQTWAGGSKTWGSQLPSRRPA